MIPRQGWREPWSRVEHSINAVLDDTDFNDVEEALAEIQAKYSSPQEFVGDVIAKWEGSGARAEHQRLEQAEKRASTAYYSERAKNGLTWAQAQEMIPKWRHKKNEKQKLVSAHDILSAAEDALDEFLTEELPGSEGAEEVYPRERWNSLYSIAQHYLYSPRVQTGVVPRPI